MTQDEFESSIAEISGASKASVAAFLEAQKIAAHKALQSGQEVKIPGLCKIAVAHKPAREARNPGTGETVQVPAHNVVKLKALKALRDAVH